MLGSTGVGFFIGPDRWMELQLPVLHLGSYTLDPKTPENSVSRKTQIPRLGAAARELQ